MSRTIRKLRFIDTPSIILMVVAIGAPTLVFLL